MTSPIGFPPRTVYEITDIAKSYPAVVTVDSVDEPNAFYLVNGMTITFSKVLGMYELNRNRYVIGSLDTGAKTFALFTEKGDPVDSTIFNTYVGGGEFNIISYPPLAGQPPGLMYNTQPINV